jgi:hypothetical protein
MTARGEASIYACIARLKQIEAYEHAGLVACIVLGTAFWLAQQREAHRSVRAWDDCQ